MATPALKLDTVNFAFEETTRRIAKPKSRGTRRFPGQAHLAPIPPPALPAPASVQAAQQAPVAAAPVPVPQSLPLAGDDGKGKASSSSAEAEPDLEQAFDLLPGMFLRSHCEDWVEACATFMSTSPPCANVSPRWITNWKRFPLEYLAEELRERDDDDAYDADTAAAFVRRMFQYSLMRRMDGPTTMGKNAIMRHLKELAAKEALDIGEVEF